MDLSIVVCTRNRGTLLEAALSHFDRVHLPECTELVLVDNGSTDDTPDILERYADRHARTTVVSAPRKGLAIARNAGIRASSGRIVAFTDDDCYPDPGFAVKTLECFAESNLGYVGGRILLWDKADLPITIQPRSERVAIAPGSFIEPGFIHGANFALRRDVFEAIGPFDERLGAGTPLHCGEDLDQLARASAAGFHGAYDPRILVYHHHRRSSREDGERLMRGYDIGRGAFYAKALRDPRLRCKYLWPAVRRVLGNLLRRDLATLRREFQGAWMYLGGPLDAAPASREPICKKTLEA